VSPVLLQLEAKGSQPLGNSKRRVDRAATRIDASPERVYGAFVDPSALIAWLPPRGARGTLEAFEPRPGGDFRMTLRFDATTSAPGKTTKSTDVVSGRFVELVPDERISLAINFVSDDPSFAGTMTMTWTLVSENAGTLVTITAVDVPPGIRPQDHKAGMESSLANLAAYVQRSRVP
jgi:uncharacterized protein YndB with AHSA1/START domain